MYVFWTKNLFEMFSQGCKLLRKIRSQCHRCFTCLGLPVKTSDFWRFNSYAKFTPIVWINNLPSGCFYKYSLFIGNPFRQNRELLVKANEMWFKVKFLSAYLFSTLLTDVSHPFARPKKARPGIDTKKHWLFTLNINVFYIHFVKYN